MIHQLSGESIGESEERFDYWADEMEKLPIYFQTFFGSTELTKILNLIDYCIYAYDVAHIILDNLQFMLSGQGRGFERFELQDDLIAKLRKIATEKNVHITIVIHPKKTEDNQDLNVSSIFGTSKSTQEADNIYIIQNRKDFKIIDVKKNRFDGEVGKKAMVFDKDCKRFYEITNKEVEKLYTGQSVGELLELKRQGSAFTYDNSVEAVEEKEDTLFEDMVKSQVNTEDHFSRYRQREVDSFAIRNERNGLSRNYNSSYQTKPELTQSVYKRNEDVIKKEMNNHHFNLETTYFDKDDNKRSFDHAQEEYFKIIEETKETDKAPDEHYKWAMDEQNQPNFYKEGDVLYTYDDIINQFSNNNNKGNGKNGLKRAKSIQEQFEDDLLDDLTRR